MEDARSEEPTSPCVGRGAASSTVAVPGRFGMFDAANFPKCPVWDQTSARVKQLRDELLLYMKAHPEEARHTVANKMIDKYPEGHTLRDIGMTLLKEGKLDGPDAGEVLVNKWVAELLGRQEGELAKLLRAAPR